MIRGVLCCWARGLTPFGGVGRPAPNECCWARGADVPRSGMRWGRVVLVVINSGTGTSDLPLRERPRGVPVGYGAPATIVVSLIVRFVVR